MKLIPAILTILISNMAWASSSYLNSSGTGSVQQAILNEYGADAGANTTSCLLCHSVESGGLGTINQRFGLDFDNAGGTSGLSVSNLQVVLRSFENTDSDGDGFSNKQEFEDKSNPNNAQDNANTPQPEQGPSNSGGSDGGGGGGCGAIITNSSGPNTPNSGLLVLLFLIPMMFLISARSYPRAV